MPEAELHFRFAGGIETKQDEKSVPTTKLLLLENGVFSKATSIRKRNGYESIATVAGAIRLAQRGDAELLAFTDKRAYSISAEGTVSDTGAVYSAVGSDRPLVATGTQQTQPDHATLNDVTVSAWEDSRGGVWWSVTGDTNGRIYRAPAQANASGQAPRCVAVGPSLHIYYALPAQKRIEVIVVDPTNPTAAASPVLMVDDLDSTNPMYDVAPTTRTGTPAVVAWFENGTNHIRIGYVHSSGAIGVPLLGLPSSINFAAARGATSPLAIAHWMVDGGTGDIIALAYVNNGATGFLSTFSGGTTSTGIASTANYNAYSSTSVTRCALVITSATTAWAAFEEAAGQPSQRFTVAVPAAIPAASGGSSVTIRSVGLASRAFARNGEAFAVFVHDTTSFNVYLALRLASGFAVAGRHAPGNAGGAPTRKHLSSVQVNGDVFSFALPWKQRLIAETTQFTAESVRQFRLDFASPESHQYAGFGRGLYLSGACPMHYDGAVWSELGFHVGPELISAVTAAGGSMTSATTYLYIAWYESTDAQGEVHLGPTSLGTIVTMGGADTQVTLTLPTLRVTGKTNVRIMVARSKAADTGDTATVRRVTSLDQSTAGAANGYIANNPAVDSVTFIDRMSDTTLAGFDEIYTDGGILSNDPTPLGAALARGKHRLLASDPSDGSVVRFSQPFDDGFGVEWPPDLSMRVDPPAGDIVAIAGFDDRQIVWTDRAIFTFAGTGPAQDGTTTTGGFSDPQLLPGNIGCSAAASLVFIPGGYLFKSSTNGGIYLLGTDGNIRYTGAPVEAFNGQTIRRATTLPDRTSVVFLTDSGSTLLYDYLFDQWSTFTNHEGQDSVVVGGQYHYLRNDGKIYRETVGAYSDAGTRITLALQTAWIHMLDQLQGWQLFGEMALLGTWLSAHQLGIQYRLDYMTELSDVVWYDATGSTDPTPWISGTNANTVGAEPISGSNYGDGQYGDGVYGGTPPGEYQWRLELLEDGHSIQFRFQDFESAGSSGPSFELTELVLIGQILGNVRRPSTAGRSA